MPPAQLHPQQHARCSAAPGARRRARAPPPAAAAAAAVSAPPAAASSSSSAADTLPALAAAREAVQHVGGWWAPPMVAQPDAALLQQPFLTRDAGVLPVKPRNLHHALWTYGSYTSKYVSVRVDNTHVRLSSWEHAVATLADADEARRPFWCSLIEAVQHPAWWPAAGHVPTYDQVIFGRGNASIGLHFDKDNACANGSRTPVSTYLAICEGAKLCLLLPPEQTLLPHGGDAATLLQPTPQLLADVKAAGGYFFVLEDAGSSGSSSSGSSSEADAFSATALYMPSGWWHWLVGLTDWHVVFGGSFYPEQQPQ